MVVNSIININKLINLVSLYIFHSLPLGCLPLLLLLTLLFLRVNVGLLLLLVFRGRRADIGPEVAKNFVPDVAWDEHVDIPAIPSEAEDELAEEVYSENVKSVPRCQSMVKAVPYHAEEHIRDSREQY